VELRQAGNVGIRRRHVEATDVYEVSDYVLTFVSEPIPTKFCTSGIFNFRWADFDAYDAKAHLQGSYDGTTWNNLDDQGALLDAPTETQIWELNEVNVFFIRLAIEFNTVTTGVFGFEFKGEFNKSKNY